MTIEMGSTWWTIDLNSEAARYSEPRTRCRPWRVKAHCRGNADMWVLSAHDEAGVVDDDSNCSVWASDRDVGRMLFADEEAAWRAYLASGSSPVGILRGGLYEFLESLERLRVEELSPTVRQMVLEHLRGVLPFLEEEYGPAVEAALSR